MRLPFTDGLIVTNHMDGEMSILADRHYSRRTVGARQFMYSGKKLVLRDTAGDVLFGWIWPDPTMRMDGQTGYCCSIFRNESRRKASDIILEAEQLAINKWGPNRMFTYVNPKKVRPVLVRGKAIYGFCFMKAGWKFAAISKGGLWLWVKGVEPEEAPEQAEVFAEKKELEIAAGDTRRQG